MNSNVKNKNLYPTERQKTFISNATYKVQPYHIYANSSARMFRFTFRLIILVYVFLLVVSAFEVLASLMQSGDEGALHVVSFGKAAIMALIYVWALAINNLMLLIFGHGLWNKENQLIVDRISDKNECVGNVKAIKSLYLVALVIALIIMWILWGGYGTPFYNSTFGDQLSALGIVMSMFESTEAAFDLGGLAVPLKPYLWVCHLGLSTIIIGCVFGWLQATISSYKMLAGKSK